MSNTDKLREFAETWGIQEYFNEDVCQWDYKWNMAGCLSDLTALISEHYIDKDIHERLVERADELTTQVNESYPKEFVEWKDKKELRYSSLHNRYYSDTDNGMREFTLDELFNYWKENEQ